MKKTRLMIYSAFVLAVVANLCISTINAQDIKKAPEVKTEVKATSVVAEAPAEGAEAPAKKGAGIEFYIQQLIDTGWTGVALGLVAIVGFGFALERGFNMKKARIAPEGLAEAANELWEKGDFKGIEIICDKKPSILADVIKNIVKHKHGAKEDVTNIVSDAASREMRKHLQKAYPMAVAAAISPLIGLFGTVCGMIEAFKGVALASEMADPAQMAGDISFALMTTALGLVIAVPCLVFFHFFKIKATMISLNLEEKASELLIDWFGVQAVEAKEPIAEIEEQSDAAE